jgi:hypothetical protein
MHARANAMPLQDVETLLPIHGVECLLQVNEDPIEGGLLNVDKLLSQLCPNYRGACPLPLLAAVQAVVQGNQLRPMVHHPFNDLPNWLKETNAAMVLVAFRDEDIDYPPKLEGYLTCIQDSLDKPS